MNLIDKLHERARGSLPADAYSAMLGYQAAEVKRTVARGGKTIFTKGEVILVSEEPAAKRDAFSFVSGFTTITERGFTQLSGDLPAPANELELLLANRGNPDFRQGPGPLEDTVSDVWVPVDDFAGASAASRAYLDENMLGSGNWVGGSVRDALTRVEVARVSYNGRVWPPTPWDPSTEPLFDPSAASPAP